MSEPAEKLPRNPGRTLPAGMIPWKPGQTGNPSGWNVINAMRRKILERTKNGEEILDVMLDIMRTSNNDVVRLKAAEMVRDWCFGKPKEQKEQPDAPSILNIASLPPEKFEQLIALLREASNGNRLQ